MSLTRICSELLSEKDTREATSLHASVSDSLANGISAPSKGVRTKGFTHQQNDFKTRQPDLGKYLVDENACGTNVRTELEPKLSCKKLGMMAHTCKPHRGGRDRNIPGIHKPASVEASFRLSKKPCPYMELGRWLSWGNASCVSTRTCVQIPRTMQRPVMVACPCNTSAGGQAETDELLAI